MQLVFQTVIYHGKRFTIFMKWIKNCKKNLRKRQKLTYNTTCRGNNKQDVSLTFAIIDKATTSAIKYPTM